MSKSDDVIKAMQDDGSLPATLKNMIITPLGSASDDMFTLRFAADIPSEVQFVCYRATCTVMVGTTAYDIPASPASPVTVSVPAGTQLLMITDKNITVSDASMACLVTNF